MDEMASVLNERSEFTFFGAYIIQNIFPSSLAFYSHFCDFAYVINLTLLRLSTPGGREYNIFFLKFIVMVQVDTQKKYSEFYRYRGLRKPEKSKSFILSD